MGCSAAVIQVITLRMVDMANIVRQEAPQILSRLSARSALTRFQMGCYAGAIRAITLRMVGMANIVHPEAPQVLHRLHRRRRHRQVEELAHHIPTHVLAARATLMRYAIAMLGTN
jgi:uncharacterized membrane protein